MRTEKEDRLLSDLYLNPGESLILTTNRISVNFIPFDLMLTSLRLILLDSIHDRFSPQVIPLGDIFSVNGGTISTGEPIIKITVTGDENDGSLIPIDFIFSQASNQKRKQERDEWLRTLMEKLVEVRQDKVLSGIGPSGEEDQERPPVRRWIAPEILYPMPLVAGPDLPAARNETISPVPEPLPAGENTTGGPDDAPSPAPEFEGPPVPAGLPNVTVGESYGWETAENTPAGEPEPAWEETWSTREKETGSVELPPPCMDEPILSRSDENLPPLAASQVEENEPSRPFAAITGTETPDKLPDTPEEEPVGVSGESPPYHVAAEPSSPDEIGSGRADTLNLSTPPVVNWPVIREDPVPGTPGFGKPDIVAPAGVICNPPEDAENKPDAHPVSRMSDGEISAPITIPAIGPVNAEGPDLVPVHENEPAIPGTEQAPGGLAGESPAPGPLQQTPVIATGADAPSGKRTVIISVAVIIGIIVIIAALGLLYVHNPPADTHLPLPTITPVITVNTTPAVKPVAIPNVGVWVRVIYPGYYYGQAGNPDGPQDIGGTGDQFYFIRNSGDLLQADIQKRDNSGDTLTVAVYNNGTQVFTTSVRSPMGTISVLIDPATGKPPVSHL